MKKIFTGVLVVVFVMSLREIVNVIRYNQVLNPYGIGYVVGNATVLLASLLGIYFINKKGLKIWLFKS